MPNPNDLKVTCHVGKNGLTDALIEEIRAQVKRNGMIKVRMLRSILESEDRKEMAQDLATRTGLVLVEAKGHTVILARKGYKS